MEVEFYKEDIQGWGIDLKPEDRPAYPMWKKTENTGSHYTEETIPMQKAKFKELQSIEVPDRTPVIGQTVPPSGLSGLIRKFAFRYGEGSFGHWLPLIFADRVNMFEGVLNDFLHLRVPNLWKEMGLGAEWKYNRKKFVQKAALSTVLLAGAAGLFLFLTNDQKTTTRARS
jgi:hypothetical protein